MAVCSKQYVQFLKHFNWFYIPRETFSSIRIGPFLKNLTRFFCFLANGFLLLKNDILGLGFAFSDLSSPVSVWVEKFLRFGPSVWEALSETSFGANFNCNSSFSLISLSTWKKVKYVTVLMPHNSKRNFGIDIMKYQSCQSHL